MLVAQKLSYNSNISGTWPAPLCHLLSCSRQ